MSSRQRTVTSIKVDLGGALGQLAILATLVAIGAVVTVAAPGVLLFALPLGFLVAQIWLIKIVLECITLTTVPQDEEEAFGAETTREPAMKPKPRGGMKLDARQD